MSRSTNETIIGTRGSELALVQANATQALLLGKFPERIIRQQIIKTTGDRRTDVALADVAKAEGTFDKGVFIKELEEALADGSVDIAVHSLKDMPTVIDARFQLASTLERAPVRDVLLSKQVGGLAALAAGSRVGTSSVRRAKQLEFLRPDLEIIDLRGNVPTRIEKLARTDVYDAILLAEAGLVRLGYIPEAAAEGEEIIKDEVDVFCSRLPENEFFPAAGQGAIGLEIRTGDEQALALAVSIGHAETWFKVSAEREFLRLLDGGCHTPVGVYSSIEGSNIHLHARVFPEQGGQPKVGSATDTDPIQAALKLFQSLK